MYNIREANILDADLFYIWVNEPEVRKNAIDSKIILLSEHLEWFDSKIKSDSSFLFLLENEKTPIGQIRFDKDENRDYWIDYSIDKKFRGKGLGNLLLNKGIIEICKRVKLPKIKAIVNENNMPSRKAIEKLNFRHFGYKLIRKQKYVVYELNHKK